MGGEKHKTENTMFLSPPYVLRLYILIQERKKTYFGTVFIFPKVTIISGCFMKHNDFLLKLACVLLSHLSHRLFVFHCPENRFQPPPPPAAQQCAQKWRRNLSWTQNLLISNSGVVAGTQNVWIQQILALSGILRKQKIGSYPHHQLNSSEDETFLGLKVYSGYWSHPNPGLVARTQDGRNVWILQMETRSGVLTMDNVNILNGG